MTFVQAIQSGFKNYVKFDGRASRSEYWWWALFAFLIYIIPGFLMMGESSRGETGIGSMLYYIIALGLFLPSLGLTFRRLHDTDRSAWWILIGLIPLVGGIVLLVFYCTPGTPGPNKFGSDPKSPMATIVKTFE